MSRLTASISERSESPAPRKPQAYTRPVAVPFEDDEEGAAHVAASSPPQHAFPPPTEEDGETAAARLPLLATASDVREVVQYLKKRPGGVSVHEAMEDTRRRVFEPRKVSAYEFWGVVERAPGERLRLTPLGWDFARTFAPEAEAYRAVLGNTEPYRAALAWVYAQGLEVVTHAQVADFWRERGGGMFERDGARALEGSVVCFFHLCQAAELGTVTLGKRGQPARLRVEREELARHVGGTGRPHFSGPHAPTPREAERQPPPAADTPAAAAHAHAHGPFRPARRVSERSRLFISGGAGAEVVGRLRVVLELAGVESIAVERGGGPPPDAPVSDAALRAMRLCDAALVVVAPEDCEPDGEGGYAVGPSVLAEVSAAYVLYERRVLLLHDRRVKPSAAFAGLPRLCFERDELTWDTGVALLRAVKEFRRDAEQGHEHDDRHG